MRAIRRTQALLAAVVAVGLLDVVAHWTAGPSSVEALPSSPGFDVEDARQITVGRTDASVVLALTDGAWRIVAPAAGPADAEHVSALLGGLANGVHPDARVDEGDFERYGLAGGSELRVEVRGAQAPLATLHLGHDAGGGSTWVRFAGEDTVYRARVGGRGTYERTPRGWRDRRIVDVEADAIVALTISGDQGQTRLAREAAGWRSPDLPIDGPAIQQLVDALAQWTALEVAAPGAGTADVRLDLELASGRLLGLEIEAQGSLWFVRASDRDDRWRVAAGIPTLLAGAPQTLADRHLWTSTSAVERIVREDERGQRVLAHSGEGWEILRPAHVDVDVRRAEAAARWLSAPRVEAWGDASKLPATPTRRWTITFADGARRTLVFGARRQGPQGGQVRVYDRRAPARWGWVDARFEAGLDQLFGSG